MSVGIGLKDGLQIIIIKAFAVHFTRGGPWFSEWQDVEFANEWIKERDEYLNQKFIL